MSPRGTKIWPRLAVIGGILSLVIVAAVFWLFTSLADDGTRQSDLLGAKPANSKIPVPEPELNLYKPIDAQQAQQENASLPFSTAPIERALPLVMPSGQLLPIRRRNAIDCLTSAIYYEAGNEIDQGKRGVAQVILNRVRHPAFPNSICAVVYQGSKRRTGCQFSYTCDGSLARRPTRKKWDQARLIAIGAISGAVEPSVGMSTHYHANYVLPYWAPSLAKVTQVGSHIFYRWKGAWGRRRAFVETVKLEDEEFQEGVTVDMDTDIASDTVEVAPPIKLPSRIIADDEAGLASFAQPDSNLTDPVVPEILADQNGSTLTADEQKSTLKNE